jgi:peptidoglycan/LPS O-acetylase OafA/YrhL
MRHLDREIAGRRIVSVHALRGIAALSVCVGHFISTEMPGAPLVFDQVGYYALFGVTAFFVVSGFVLPLTLYRNNYRVAGFLRFVGRRILRLEPPYLITILGVLGIGYVANATPWFRGHFVPDPLGWALHIGYLAPLFGKEWLVGAFWTLCVEFQFYILIGLVFPLLMRFPIVMLCGLCLPTLIDPSHGPTISTPLYKHLPIFLIGTCAFMWHEKVMHPLMASGLQVTIAFYYGFLNGITAPLVAMAAAHFILWASPSSPVLAFFGTISYSLYLWHLPIGLRVFNLARRFTDQWPLIVLLEFAVTISVAWLMCRLIEAPSIRWSGKLSYEPHSIDTVPIAIAAHSNGTKEVDYDRAANANKGGPNGGIADRHYDTGKAVQAGRGSGMITPQYVGLRH